MSKFQMEHCKYSVQLEIEVSARTRLINLSSFGVGVFGVGVQLKSSYEVKAIDMISLK